MDVSRMDPISAKLAVELQLSDINDILDEIGGSRLRGDQRIGFETMKTEMEGKLQLLETQVLIYNLLRAEHDSRVAFSKLLEEEKQAVDDHKLAMNLQGLRVDDPHVRSCAKYEESLCDEEDVDSDDEWNRARELYSSGFCRGVAGLPPLDEMGSEDHSDVGDGEITCNACLEAVPTNDSLELACDHTYCRTCLTDHFKSALTDTGLFPPRCCKIAIPVDICRAVLPKDMVKEFDLKVEELAHPNPTYCYNAECAEFIQAKNITNDVGNCVFCRNKTCVLCKCEEHAGLCPTDPHVVLLKDLANRSKWQQCSRCKNMVELAVGCFHMTCRCRHQFCYLCGIPWKKCSCPQWDENYLTRPTPVPNTVQPVPQIAPVRAPDLALRQLNQVVGQLCVHDWTRNNSGGVCEACDADYLPYLYRCGDCHRLSCWRCINNRG